LLGKQLPALNDAERDRLEQRLSPDEEAAVIDATRELMADVAASIQRLQPAAPTEDPPLPGAREPLRVLGYATNGVADEVALAMLAHLVDDLPIAIEMIRTRMQASELVALVQAQHVSRVQAGRALMVSTFIMRYRLMGRASDPSCDSGICSIQGTGGRRKGCPLPSEQGRIACLTTSV
jgi:hypothetical protein